MSTRIFLDEANVPRSVVIDGVAVPAVLGVNVDFQPLKPMTITVVYTDPDTRIIRPGDPDQVANPEEILTLGQP